MLLRINLLRPRKKFHRRRFSRSHLARSSARRALLTADAEVLGSGVLPIESIKQSALARSADLTSGSATFLAFRRMREASDLMAVSVPFHLESEASIVRTVLWRVTEWGLRAFAACRHSIGAHRMQVLRPWHSVIVQIARMKWLVHVTHEMNNVFQGGQILIVGRVR